MLDNASPLILSSIRSQIFDAIYSFDSSPFFNIALIWQICNNSFALGWKVHLFDDYMPHWSSQNILQNFSIHIGYLHMAKNKKPGSSNRANIIGPSQRKICIPFFDDCQYNAVDSDIRGIILWLVETFYAQKWSPIEAFCHCQMGYPYSRNRLFNSWETTRQSLRSPQPSAWGLIRYICFDFLNQKI